MEQMRLDEWVPGQRPPRARRADPDSSHAAADRAELRGSIARHLELALRSVHAFPGLTSSELADVTIRPEGMDAGTWRVERSRRRPELRRRALVKRTRLGKGERRWWPIDHATPPNAGLVEEG